MFFASTISVVESQSTTEFVAETIRFLLKLNPEINFIDETIMIIDTLIMIVNTMIKIAFFRNVISEVGDQEYSNTNEPISLAIHTLIMIVKFAETIDGNIVPF